MRLIPFYRLDMYGRAYQWLIMATYTTDWWNVTLDSECSVEEIAVALEGAILVDLLPLSTSGDITVAGIVSSILIALFQFLILSSIADGR